MADERIQTNLKTSGGKSSGLLSDKVAQRIMSMIADGELHPGQRLPGERQLAEKMGVSRVSVRAALQSLKAQGLLEAVQGGGTRIIAAASEMSSPLSELLKVKTGNLHDLAEIRAILEVWAAKRAAQNATDHDIQRLEAALNKLEQHEDDHPAKEKVKQEFKFHYLVAQAAHSTVYIHIMDVFSEIISTSLETHAYELFQEPKDSSLAIQQHRQVFEAIRDRNPDGAADAMRNHLSWVLDNYEHERERHQQEFAGPPEEG